MSQQPHQSTTEQRPLRRHIDPLTAVGALIALVAVTAIVTYLLLTRAPQVAAQAGPPERFLAAATQQAINATRPPTDAPTEPGDADATPTPTSPPPPTPVITAAPGTSPAADSPAESVVQATANPFGNWPIPDNMESSFWLSIPAIEVEAPVIAFSPWEREVDGVPVLRLPVPNFYGVSWHTGSAQPGFAGNTVISGHSNLYGGVFGDLDELTYGQEIALWSELGVFSYYISQIEYMEEDGQPLAVRQRNAQWLNATTDNRVTLITCWPRSDSSHRLIVVATR